jgi:hypothetical protein
MLFGEIIPVYTENHKTHKYKMQSYWLLKQMVPLGFKVLNY